MASTVTGRIRAMRSLGGGGGWLRKPTLVAGSW